MSSNNDIPLMAHILRRAGFGATRDDLERYQVIGYEKTVEQLLHPGDQTESNDDLAFRYVPYDRMGTGIISYQSYWMYRMISTNAPLDEKMA